VDEQRSRCRSACAPPRRAAVVVPFSPRIRWTTSSCTAVSIPHPGERGKKRGGEGGGWGVGGGDRDDILMSRRDVALTSAECGEVVDSEGTSRRLDPPNCVRPFASLFRYLFYLYLSISLSLSLPLRSLSDVSQIRDALVSSRMQIVTDPMRNCGFGSAWRSEERERRVSDSSEVTVAVSFVTLPRTNARLASDVSLSLSLSLSSFLFLFPSFSFYLSFSLSQRSWLD